MDHDLIPTRVPFNSGLDLHLAANLKRSKTPDAVDRPHWLPAAACQCQPVSTPPGLLFISHVADVMGGVVPLHVVILLLLL